MHGLPVMLNRQKILLHLLDLAARPVHRTELTKWCFLLRHDSPSRGGNAFYDFVPYRFGPFSFALYQEADKLESQHYVRAEGEQGWILGEVVNVVGLSRQIAHDCAAIVDRFRNSTLDSLIDHVYQAYPRFTFNSERRQLARKPVASVAVYTAGYESLSIDAFLNLLAQQGIRRVIDVRRNPVARRYGFHKSTLTRLTGRLSIDYVHIPELGIASEKRRTLDTDEDYARLFQEYVSETLSSESNAIARTCKLVKEEPSVLVCMEANPAYCHRARLAAEVSNATGLAVRHLPPKP